MKVLDELRHLDDFFGQLVAALDAAVAEVGRYGDPRRQATAALLDALEKRFAADATTLAAVENLRVAAAAAAVDERVYGFDRKFLFKVLVLANAQLAQLTGARGPNLQTNAACAGTTQAVALAQDLLRAGRCDRVLVVSGDDASGDAPGGNKTTTRCLMRSVERACS